MIFSIPLFDELMKDAKFVNRHHLYDAVDKLHFIVTVFALMCLALIIGAKQHFGQPIDCLIPKEQDGVASWKSYIENFCLMYGTYRYNSSAGAKVNFTGYDPQTNVQYYQWVAFFLAAQSVCFVLPHWIWSWMQKLFYLDMSVLIEQCSKLNEEKNEAGVKERINRMTNYAYSHFRYRRLSNVGFIEKFFRLNFIGCCLYFLSKLITLANVILQLVLLNHFLGFKDIAWGFDIIRKYLAGDHLQSNGLVLKSGLDGENSFFPYFPIMVACDYYMHVGISAYNQQKNTVQCILPMNVINEKIFIGVYLWFIFLLAVTVANIFSLFFTTFLSSERENFILSLLNSESNNLTLKSNKAYNVYQQKKDFVHDFLGADGVLLFRFMSPKCGTLSTRTFARALWEMYQKDNENVATMSNTGSGKTADEPDFVEHAFGDHPNW